MSKFKKACGVDVHRDLLVATILSDDQSKSTEHFVNNQNGIDNLKKWVKTTGCRQIVMESTCIYWVPLYLALEESGFEVSLANAHQVKAIPGRKTDQTSSQWLAHLLLGGQINPSYVPEKGVRELRELTRLRAKLVQTRTAFKNRCHKVLNRVDIRLGSRLKDVFGKAGTEILKGLMAGMTVEAILEKTENRWLRNRSDEIKAVARGALSQLDIFVLKELTDTVTHLDEKIGQVEDRMDLFVSVQETVVGERKVEIVSSVPGVGRRSAVAIVAEIGDVKHFASGDCLASWAGLAPSVYQSAGKILTGHITKAGCRWLRRAMVLVARTAVRVRDSCLRAFFLRVKARKGKNTAYVAVARKMLTIIWHLLVNDEMYAEEGFSKVVRSGKVAYGDSVSFEDMARILRCAGYVVLNGPDG
jgi:transposase